MKQEDHWNRVYATKTPSAVSWFQEHAEQSLRLIRDTGVSRSASIIDVGGGASTLVDDLIQDGYSNVTVLDLSPVALTAARGRIGSRASEAKWIAGDITTVQLPEAFYDVWHDRAVFHFLTEAEERHAYVAQVLRAVKPGGHVIVATFAEDGPTKCSGLPVMRYSATALHSEFGASFTLLRHEKEEHHTPFGTTQKFVYCYCRRVAS